MPWMEMLQPHPCWTHFKVIPEVHFMHTISHFKSWEVSSPKLQAVLDLEVKRRSYGRLKTNVQSWTEMLQPHPIFATVGHVFGALYGAQIMHTICHFEAAKWVYGAVKWQSCAKGWFRNCETPFQMASRLQNGGFQGVEVLQPFRSWETGVRACEMALVCQGTSSQLRKFSQRVLGGCETISQRGGRFSQRLTFAAKFRNPCSLLAFWAPLDSQLPSFTFDYYPKSAILRL